MAVVNEYADAVESGKDDERPQFQLLLRDIERKDRGWEFILTLDTSRISRRVFISAAFEHDCEKNRIGVVYRNLPDMEPAELLLFKTIMQGMDHYHSLKSRAKGLAGMAENVRQGWRAGGRAPRGYKLEYTATGAIREGEPVTKSKLVLGDESELVAAYLKGRAKGESRGVLIARLRIDWPSSSLVGMEWQALTYAGHNVWNVHAEREGGAYMGGSKRRPRSDWLITRNTHEPLISDDEAERILAGLERYKEIQTRKATHEYLLTGLLVTPSGDQWHGDEGNCYRVGKGRRVSSARLDKTVMDRVKADLTTDVAIQRVTQSLQQATGVAPDKKRIPAIEKRLAALSAKIGRLVDLTASVDDPAPYLRGVTEMEAERSALLVELDQVKTSIAQARTAKQFGMEEVRKLLDALWRDLEVRQEITETRTALQEMIARIELAPGSTQVTIHYAVPVASAISADTTGVTLASPRGLEPDQPATGFKGNPVAEAIAATARDLIDKRENALVSGRSLTNLYNERPTWLADAHTKLDSAVAAAYGWMDWGPGLADEVILTRLLAENQARLSADGPEVKSRST